MPLVIIITLLYVTSYSLSRKDREKCFSPGMAVNLPAFFSHYMLGAGVVVCEYPLVICRYRVYVYSVVLAYADVKRPS